MDKENCAPVQAITFILELMKICGITLNTTEFSPVRYFSIYIKLLKRGEKQLKSLYDDIKM